MDIHGEIQTLRSQANYYRELADQFEKKAFQKLEKLNSQLMRKRNDKLINRKKAISLLWFTTHQALKDWERKLEGTEYLRFEDNKILRSEVLKFRDDYYNGKLHKKLRKAGKR